MNRLRIVTLSALILALVAGGLPVTQSLAKWSRGAAVAARKKKGKYRRRSRAWWRRHRARQRARRERIERRRRERLAAWRTANPGLPAPAALAAPVGFRSVNSNLRRNAAGELPLSAATRPALLPFEFTLPHNWAAPRRGAGGETTFSVRTPDGRAAGTAVVAPVSLQSEAAPSPRIKSVGGVTVTTLRRTVIDRMVAAGGWVTNDFVKETNGRRVFVVLAQTGAPGAPAQSLTFYFTEIDGRLYSLATNVAVEFAEPVAAGSEQFMASIRTAGARNLATQK